MYICKCVMKTAGNRGIVVYRDTSAPKKKKRLDISGAACHNCEKGCGVDAVKGTISDTSLIDS